MKKLSKTPLSLTRTTVRSLQTEQLDLAAGGYTTLYYTEICPTKAYHCGTRTCPQ